MDDGIKSFQIKGSSAPMVAGTTASTIDIGNLVFTQNIEIFSIAVDADLVTSGGVVRETASVRINIYSGTSLGSINRIPAVDFNFTDGSLNPGFEFLFTPNEKERKLRLTNPRTLDLSEVNLFWSTASLLNDVVNVRITFFYGYAN